MIGAVREVGGPWLPTLVGVPPGDPNALSVTVAYNPTDLSFFTDPTFDYAANGWIPVVQEHVLTNQVAYSYFAGTRNNPVGVSFVDGGGGTDPSWYRAPLPFC